MILPLPCEQIRLSGKGARNSREMQNPDRLRRPLMLDIHLYVILNSMKQAVNRASSEIRHYNLSQVSGTTPVPNDLLDRVMPTLRDTELRVLLIVVRQTAGWQTGTDPAQRKERDWLTQSQLMRRTGRASGAVSRAVDALVQAGLIHVTDRAGAPLKTPAERRRHLGHLYYQSGPGVAAPLNPAKSEHAKGHTTKETVTQKYRAEKEIVDNSGEKSPPDKPFFIRTRGWEKATHSSNSSSNER